MFASVALLICYFRYFCYNCYFRYFLHGCCIYFCDCLHFWAPSSQASLLKTATEIRALEGRSLGSKYLKSPRFLRFSVTVRVNGTLRNNDVMTTCAAAETSFRQNGIHEIHLVLLIHNDLG